RYPVGYSKWLLRLTRGEALPKPRCRSRATSGRSCGLHRVTSPPTPAVGVLTRGATRASGGGLHPRPGRGAAALSSGNLFSFIEPIGGNSRLARDVMMVTQGVYLPGCPI